METWFEGAKLKIERAKEHIGDLNREVRQFFDTNPYPISPKRDAQNAPRDLQPEARRAYVGAYSSDANAEVNDTLQFRFNVALNEPGIVEGKPLLETLHQLAALVEGIVVALAHRLRATT